MPTSMRRTMPISGSGSRRGDLSAATSSSSPASDRDIRRDHKEAAGVDPRHTRNERPTARGVC